MIFGIHGKKQTGKDTIAKYLVENYGFKRYAFADELKRHVYILNPIVVLDDGYTHIRYRTLVDSVGLDEAKETCKEVRRLLQIYGTEVVRDCVEQNFWVNFVFSKIEENKNQSAVISDLRFPNELDKAIKSKAVTIKVKSNRIKYNDKHASEQDLPDYHFDHIIQNDGTLEELYEKVNLVMSRHK